MSHIYGHSRQLMKTTVEIPDALFHRAKVVSAQRRVPLKQLIIEGLEHALASPPKSKPIELTEEQAKVLRIDEHGVPVLKARNIPPEEFLAQIEKLREELGI